MAINFFSTEVGKRFTDYQLKTFALEAERLAIINGQIYKWFDRTTGRPVSAPWLLIQEQQLSQHQIDNVVLFQLSYDRDFLFGNENILFSFPVITILPYNPNFPNFVFEIGDDNNNNITGDAAPEFLWGLQGDDNLNGGDGNDVFSGEEGRDTLTGGNGSDRFAVAINVATYGADYITDFNVTQDIIFVNPFMETFPGLTLHNFITPDQFNMGTNATTPNHRFIYDKNTGQLFFDIDGNGAEPQRHIASLSPGLALSHQNLFFTDNPDYLLTVQPTYTPPPIDPAQYGASNGDLLLAFQNLSHTDKLAAFSNHYYTYGFLEARPTDTFDELRYIASNPGDLIGAFGLNGAAATEHYIRNGFFERRSTTAFIPSRYILSHPGDLLGAFGTNLQAATFHYITNGLGEGRNPNLFASDRYIASNPDLIRAYRYNLEAGSNHYLFHGIGEGRPINFDPQAYLNRYGDLQTAFGNDLVGATQHYIVSGFDEGRTWM